MQQRPLATRPTILVANPSADLYGSDRMMLESVAGFLSRGWRVIVAASQSGPLIDELNDLGASTVIFPVPVVRRQHMSAKGILHLARDVVGGLRPMARLLRKVRPDLVYVNTLTVPFWVPLCRLLRIPTVVHVHEAETSAPAVARLSLQAPTMLANAVIYNSETSRRCGNAKYRGLVRVIRNGVRGPETRSPLPESLESPRLVVVGRLSPRKGIDVAVEALASVLETWPDATLTLVGAVFPGYEWYEEDVRRLTNELGMAARVNFAGFHEDVWPFLGAADIALVPSRGEESFGNAVVEAALAGRPVVVSDHSGLREAVRGIDTALLVDPGSPRAFAHGVAQLAKDWASVRVQAAAVAERLETTYSPDTYRAAVADVVAGVIGLT